MSENYAITVLSELLLVAGHVFFRQSEERCWILDYKISNRCISRARCEWNLDCHCTVFAGRDNGMNFATVI
jgi:hypothetical protein